MFESLKTTIYKSLINEVKEVNKGDGVFLKKETLSPSAATLLEAMWV